MIYCPIINDYVDQEEDCIGCIHYIEIEDICNHPDAVEDDNDL